MFSGSGDLILLDTKYTYWLLVVVCLCHLKFNYEYFLSGYQVESKYIHRDRRLGLSLCVHDAHLK